VKKTIHEIYGCGGSLLTASVNAPRVVCFVVGTVEFDAVATVKVKVKVWILVIAPLT